LKKQNVNPEQNYIAANFDVYPVFENLIREKYRSGLYIRIISPQKDQQFSIYASILFSWESKLYESLKIIILNNKAELIVEIKDVVDNTVIFNKKLQPGLYYWKLETENDLVYLGKFVIK
jgi:hypothetical protein